MTKLLDTVLLMALPASGKSEVRRFMELLTPAQCRKDMHMGPTLQLDDYPYVHFMHCIDDELGKMGFDYIFYKGPTRPFKDGMEWGTLVELLNLDYEDLCNSTVINVSSASQWLFERLDTARSKFGLGRELGKIPWDKRIELGHVLENEVAEFIREKNKVAKTDKTGKTIVIELARGGANGSQMPLTPPQGYAFAFETFSEHILSRASILYVWVTPEESRRKNYERAKPDGQSSILHHGVPLEVMLGEYGCDDMEYLIETSDRKDTVKVERFVAVKKGGKQVYVTKKWNIPIARFDNRSDLTTFIRKDKKDWKDKEYKAMYSGLSEAMKTLAEKSK
ncbi:hypothetical protein KA996_03940 [bacterium]|nr:hypothetical protein [bacterium]HPV21662.1 hypothetical protein [bacterium]